MFAIIQVGSKQFKVSEGDEIAALRLDTDEGKTFHPDKVLLFASGKDVRVGQPALKDVKVTGKVIKHTQGDKKVAFKYRKRKDSAVKHGAREKLTTIAITKIAAE